MSDTYSIHRAIIDQFQLVRHVINTRSLPVLQHASLLRDNRRLGLQFPFKRILHGVHGGALGSIRMYVVWVSSYVVEKGPRLGSRPSCTRAWANSSAFSNPALAALLWLRHSDCFFAWRQCRIAVGYGIMSVWFLHPKHCCSAASNHCCHPSFDSVLCLELPY